MDEVIKSLTVDGFSVSIHMMHDEKFQVDVERGDRMGRGHGHTLEGAIIAALKWLVLSTETARIEF